MGDEHGKSISISTLASTVSSLLVLVPVLWFVGKPLITEALAEDFKKIAQEQAEPVKNAFSVLLTRDINNLRREIAGLKFRQRNEADEWTEDDAAYLAELEIELESLQDAREELDTEDESD